MLIGIASSGSVVICSSVSFGAIVILYLVFSCVKLALNFSSLNMMTEAMLLEYQ